MEKECDFCDREILSSQIIHAGKWASIIYPRNPIIKNHFILITNRHIKHIGDANDSEIIEIRDLFSLLKASIVDNLKEGGFNLISNYGSSAGQHIDHFHIHIFLRSFQEKYSPLDVLTKKIEGDRMSKEECEKNLMEFRELVK